MFSNWRRSSELIVTTDKRALKGGFAPGGRNSGRKTHGITCHHFAA
jgi:hypothetical protein